MTNNEKIAKWLGAQEVPASCIISEDINIVFWGDESQIRDPAAFTGWRAFSPSTDIRLWHGENGLLAEIKKRGKSGELTRNLAHQVDAQGIGMLFIIGNITIGDMWRRLWVLIDHEPSQLSAALVNMIEEENKGGVDAKDPDSSDA